VLRCAGRSEFNGAHLLPWAAGLIVDARLVTGQQASSSHGVEYSVNRCSFYSRRLVPKQTVIMAVR